jgi:hypothetical protein
MKECPFTTMTRENFGKGLTRLAARCEEMTEMEWKIRTSTASNNDKA